MTFKMEEYKQHDSPHLTALENLLDDSNKSRIYPCIRDLVSNGLTLSRFAEGEMRPSRQDITQFIAAWLRHIGSPPDEHSDWLIGYCLDILSPISSSSPSRIRHSTRSNIKYINRSEVEFNCKCENNAFKAVCSRDCPVYNKMQIRRNQPEKRRVSPASDAGLKKQVEDIPQIPVKEIYKEQFQEGLKVIKESLGKGLAIKTVVDILNERGFKTRTGRKWTYGILKLEIQKNDLDKLPER